MKKNICFAIPTALYLLAFIDIDDEAGIFFKTNAMQYMQSFEEAETSIGRSARNYIYQERDVVEECLLKDYFGDNPKYRETYFRCLYRMSSRLFLKLVKGIETYIKTNYNLPAHFDYFRVRPYCTGVLGFCVIMKLTSAIR